MVPGETVKDIVAEIVKAADPLRVYVFGSVGRGDARSGSDLDILVVTSDPFESQRRRMEDALLIRRAIRSFRLPADILLYSQDEVDKWAGTTNHTIARALREGMLAYERH